MGEFRALAYGLTFDWYDYLFTGTAAMARRNLGGKLLQMLSDELTLNIFCRRCRQ